MALNFDAPWHETCIFKDGIENGGQADEREKGADGVGVAGWIHTALDA
jgi:hypothetical protein